MTTSTSSSTQWSPDQIADQTGRTALITGANSGIGLETARWLATHGARVILAGRTQAKLDEAVASITRAVPAALLDTLVLDLSDLSSIRDAAAPIAASGTLDLLVNNAGVMNLPERRTAKDGFEMTFGTNHLGHFALTAQLMPAIRRSARARIVTVSAIAGTWPSGRLVDLQSERRYRPMGAYAKSKRANIVFTEHLAQHLAGTNIEAVVVHPGSAMTGLQQHSQGAIAKRLSRVMERFLMGSADGAAWPSLYAATSDSVRSGQFIGPAGRVQTSGTPRPVRIPRGADSAAETDRLWSESERLTGVAFPL
ncbi:oxidoreductase [Curtobacterium pusillum]|uniref:oxidoreductase n=1 Tax=Curtobacterium pusillum TaxID=69373 RepID=UPI0011A610FE|nr:oxidoreductase [Curtobacterium pusillum]